MYIRFMIIAMALGYLSGCASGARMENMVYDGPTMVYDKSLETNVDVASVTGGEKTNPAWTSEIDNNAFANALKASLSEQRLLSEQGRYMLEVIMLQVEQPMFGLDFEVTTHIKYLLTDRKQGGAVVLNETIIAPYTATFSDAFAGVERLRLANEGSGRTNIRGLLEALSRLAIQPGEISLAQ